MIGSSILHYNILEKLGEGGMGVVYKAEDTKLDRLVAIKFLPHHISINEEEKKRFIIEAKAAAALNHPNIATIYSIEETDEDLFIVMEYIEGVELKDKIKKENLSIEEAIDFAIQITEGLETAHKKGIVHRDIKSSNIMITIDERIKIMDFGLAKVGEGINLTKTGSTIGTAAYMSPEQAKGERLDHKTDIWSFGVVLYEMLTSRLPFWGEYDQAVTYQILNETPVSPDKQNIKIPKELNNIILKCLEKDTIKRYQNFNEILIILKKLSPKNKDEDSLQKKSRKTKFKRLISASLIIILVIISFFIIKHFNQPTSTDLPIKDQIKRIAVLPFNNIKNDPATNFLGFALADQIISSLAYEKDIVVRPASSIRQYQNKNISPVQAGNKLHVGYILDGSYLKDANVIRLNLELVNVHSDEIVWKNDFDVNFVNTFKLQDLVSKKVKSGLMIKFENNSVIKNIPKNSKAYEYYLKSISYPYTIKGSQKAIALLKHVLRLDSTYAPAYNELGSRFHLIAQFDPEEKGMKKAAEIAFQKALSLNNNLLSALTNLAGLYNESGKHLEGVKLAKRALKINPNNADAHFLLGYIFRYTGLMDNALNQMEIVQKINPHDTNDVGVIYLYDQRYNDALKAFAPDSTNYYSLGWEGQIYLRMKKLRLAKKYLKKSIEIEPNGLFGNWAKAMLYYANGDNKGALNVLKIINMKYVYDGEEFYNCANMYGLLGDEKDCIYYLNKAIKHGFYNYPLMLNDTFLKSVRNNPEFKKTLETAKNKSEKFQEKLIENSLL